MKTKYRFICPECGKPALIVHGYCAWNEDTGRFEVTQLDEDRENWCDDCQCEVWGIHVPLEVEDLINNEPHPYANHYEDLLSLLGSYEHDDGPEGQKTVTGLIIHAIRRIAAEHCEDPIFENIEARIEAARVLKDL